MTLVEAIAHCEEVAEENESKANRIEQLHLTGNAEGCRECASDHRQLEEWLKALKEIWDSGDCNDCGNRGCLYKPKLGQLVRYNCPFYSKEVNADE